MTTTAPAPQFTEGQRVWIVRNHLDSIGGVVRSVGGREIEVITDVPYIGHNVALFWPDGTAYRGDGRLSTEAPEKPQYDGPDTLPCVECGAPTPLPEILRVKGPNINPNAVECDACLEKRLAKARLEDEEASQRIRLAAWQDWLRENKADSMQSMDAFPVQPDYLKALRAWTAGEMRLGFVLSGPSGSGKTTVMFRALRHAFMHGRSCGYVTHERLNELFHAASHGRGDAQGEASQTLYYLRICGVLLIDDMGRASEAEAEGLKDLLESRNKAGKAVLYSTQFTGRELLSKLSSGFDSVSEHAKAICRRLKEFSPAFEGAKES